MKKIDTITITSRQVVLLNALGMVLLFGGIIAFNILFDTSNSGLAPWELIGVYAATIILHEFTHGIGFMLNGARPTFGAGIEGMMPYCYATSRTKLSVHAMLLVAYLPIVMLSVVFITLAYLLPDYQSWCMGGFLANLGGSIGDLWIASKTWKYRTRDDIMVLDTKTGVEIYVA